MLLNKNKITDFKNRLLNINDKEPLSKMSLIVIIALDIFVMCMIFAGVRDHTDQLTSPNEYMPTECREAFVKNTWIGERKIDNLQKTVLSYGDNYRYRARDILDNSEIEKSHPACKKFLSSIQKVRKNKEILEVFRKRQSIQKEIKQITKEFNKFKDVYDTSLLENISNENVSNGIPAISKKSKIKSDEINELNQRLTQINKIISTNRSVGDFSNVLNELLKGRDNIITDIKKFDFWYPIKELSWQFIFLVPLFLIFYFWNSRSIKNKNSLQILISSHLLVVAFVPILFRILELINDILPHRLFKKVVDLLTSLKIIALWHYIIIILSVFVAILAIYFIQKKIFSKENIEIKRLMKGACYKCGKKLPPNIHACPFCGTQQKNTCPKCKIDTYKSGKYCINCGTPISE